MSNASSNRTSINNMARPGSPTVFSRPGYRPPTSSSRPSPFRPSPSRPPTSIRPSASIRPPTSTGTAVSDQTKFPPGTKISKGPQPGTIVIQEPGRPPIITRDPRLSQPLQQGQPGKKKKSWVGKIIWLVIIIVIAVGIFLILYFLVFTQTSDGGGSGGGGGGNNIVPKPPSTAPFQDYAGSGGQCSVDTDCPVVMRNENSILVPYSQYCVNPKDLSGVTDGNQGICTTNKVCQQSSDCQSIPGIDELPDCDLANGEPCNFTGGCAGGYCQRLRCQTSSDCGILEACTINNPGSDQYGYCLPLGNTCTSSPDTGSGAIECWGGEFQCTADFGLAEGNATGYCTECQIGGNDQTCNISNNPNSGPGSVCSTIPLNVTSGNTLPATCQMVNNFTNTACPNPASQVVAGGINSRNVCCIAATSDNMCGKSCYDDYMCSDDCPFCVSDNKGAKVCSCTRTNTYQSFYDVVESSYSCINSNGVTMIDNTRVTDHDSYMVPNRHACINTPGSNAKCVYNYFSSDNGDMNCSASSPYCNISTNTCSNDIVGSRCKRDKDEGYSCETFDSGIWSRDDNYVCAMDHTCRQRKLQAGENCWGQENQCDSGLVCTDILNTNDLFDGTEILKMCVPNGSSS